MSDKKSIMLRKYLKNNWNHATHSKSKAKTENQKKIEITIPLDENIIQLQLLNEIRNRAKSDEVSIIESIDDESESEDGCLKLL